MRLSSFFIQGNQPHIEGNGKEISPSVMEQNLKNGRQEISGKAPGQSVTGEVIEKNGNDILIAIGKNQLLRARLDSNIPIEQGQQMTFAIKNAGGSKVILSPLFANTANNPNISKALQMAGIPENEASVKMVQSMMKEGMPIDRESLSQMMRTVNLNPQADVETLVQLTRLGLPVTENNIFQMEAYKNYEHQMTDGLLAIADALADSISEMTVSGDVQGGIELYKEMISLLTQQEEGASSVNGEALREPGTVIIQDAEILEAEALNSMGSEETKETDFLQEETWHAPETEHIQENISSQAGALEGRDGLTGKELMNLAGQLRQAGMPEELIRTYISGNISSEELLKQINEKLFSKTAASGSDEAEGILQLLKGKELNKLVKNEMTSQWMLSPEEISEKQKVEELYQRLNNQLNRLNRILEQGSRTDTPLAKAVSNLSGNIDFMNQMNQMFTYVQIPLKMQGQEANGELYVYTNKKNLAEKDGEVSALLHLDMENLGSVDVHVAMRDNKVSTKFYLRDDSALDLIAEHIDTLNERLNKRGYSMNASFIKRDGEEPETVMEEILKQDKNISVLSGNSFDARA